MDPYNDYRTYVADGSLGRVFWLPLYATALEKFLWIEDDLQARLGPLETADQQ